LERKNFLIIIIAQNKSVFLDNYIIKVTLAALALKKTVKNLLFMHKTSRIDLSFICFL